MGDILVGTSSWTDKTLIESGKFYQRSATTPEDRLRFYASQFPIVEIDSSYYGIPAIDNAERWVRTANASDFPRALARRHVRIAPFRLARADAEPRTSWISRRGEMLKPN